MQLTPEQTAEACEQFLAIIGSYLDRPPVRASLCLTDEALCETAREIQRKREAVEQLENLAPFVALAVTDKLQSVRLAAMVKMATYYLGSDMMLVDCSEARQDMAEVREAVRGMLAPATSDPVGLLSFRPGGYSYRGIECDLPGKPLEVLRATHAERDRRITCAELQRTVWKDSECGQETIKNAVSDARKSLKSTMRKAGIKSKKDPIPCVERGANLAWKLNLS